MEMLTWGNLRSLLDIGEPAVVPLHAKSECSFIVNEIPGTFSLRLPNPERVGIRRANFKELLIREGSVAGRPYWELMVSEHSFGFPLYLLSLSIVQAIDSGMEMPVAVGECIQQWSALTRERQLLSVSEQVGLMGELAVLRALATVDSASALEAWTGPLGEPHDFRLASGELEVKTTLSADRVHKIHGLAQLTASGDLPLYLVSLQFQPAGAGHGVALPALIDAVAGGLPSACRPLFLDRLSSLGYSTNDAAAYSDRYAFRTVPLICSVDAEFPALTRHDLALAVGSRSNNIRDVEYEIAIPKSYKSVSEHNIFASSITRSFDI